MLHRISYFSNLSPGSEFSDLMQIARQSAETNRKRQLTGLLLYAECNIYQILEGPRSALEQVFGKILKDPRHSGIIVLTQSDIQSRLTTGWSFGFRSTGEDIEDDIVFSYRTAEEVRQHFKDMPPADERVFIETFLRNQ